MAKLNKKVLEVVDADARESARLFVEEFGTDAAATNSTPRAEAFANGNWQGHGAEVCEHHEVLWPRWSKLFRAETERLAAEGDA
jgi:hypothetical protein